ncbi:MAG TPA: alkaline phosphatase family protein, partial [Acidimicrobiales bacterium]|nr:alkaline phosphatase family protein [Acidimicrobiales bacterium]
MTDNTELSSVSPYSRRRFLGQAAAAAAGVVATPIIGSGLAGASKVRGHLITSKPRAGATPIKQIVVCCQENHSYDHYFGSYSGNPAGYGIPSSFPGWTTKPFHFTNLIDNGFDPNHDWTATHTEYANGKMDGFVAANGTNSMGYYEAADLPYYYSLLPKYASMARYHCGVLSETYPNRLVLYSGTSGGYTDNSISNGTL